MTPTRTRFRPQGPSGSTRPSAGFTLIELLIAIAVIGILASIAYPQYTDYVKSARVADGKALVMSTAGALERCYTVDNSYADCISTFPLVSDEQFYEITSANYTASFASYTLTATGDADLVKCAELHIDHQGNRSSDNGCW